MKILYACIVLVFLVVFSSCKKKAESYMNTATINGYDLRNCACCGGLLVNFDGNTKAYSGTFYDCDNDPSSLGIDSATVFPVTLQVNWKKDGICDTTHIYITAHGK